MSKMHGPDNSKERREENYRTFYKFAIALVVMLVLVGIANLVGGA